MERFHAEEARRRFEQLFDRHRRSVLAYALRRVDDPADAADVLAATFLVAWRRIERVPDGELARPWLLAVARRALANERRGMRRRDALVERLGHELTVRLAAEPHAAPVGDDGSRVRAALARLSEEDREIVLLAGWEDLSPAEIAIVLGLRHATARSRLHRARRRLRAHLDDEGSGGDVDPLSRARAARPLHLTTEEAR